jgi:hypothetical protein
MAGRCVDCGQLLGFFGLVGVSYVCDNCGAKLCKQCVRHDEEKKKDYCEKCWKTRNVGFFGKLFGV